MIQELRKLPAHTGVPIIFLTTESDDGMKQQAKAAGATGWLTKPFEPEQLVQDRQQGARQDEHADPIETFRRKPPSCWSRSSRACSTSTHRLDDRDLIDAVFRGLHTLKGSGAMFGFDALAAFTHHFETRLRPGAQGRGAGDARAGRGRARGPDHMRALVEETPTRRSRQLATRCSRQSAARRRRAAAGAVGGQARRTARLPACQRTAAGKAGASGSACRPTPWRTAPIRCPARRAARARRHARSSPIRRAFRRSTRWCRPTPSRLGRRR